VNTQQVKAELVKYAHRMYQKGLVAGTEGNLSARVSDKEIWMTPSGVNKGDITEDMLVCLDIDGNIVAGDREPTSERWMHLEAYRQRPDVMAVAHGHPIFCCAFASARVPLPEGILPELIATIGEVPIVPYGKPSSPKLAEAVRPYYPHHNCFLLENHGALAVGRSLHEAYYRLEVLEAYAKTMFFAKLLGGPKPLKVSDIQDLPKPSFG
jgi:Ribulose-5-phosphate 4-epimerase and related epimerases and aldolases